MVCHRDPVLLVLVLWVKYHLGRHVRLNEVLMCRSGLHPLSLMLLGELLMQHRLPLLEDLPLPLLLLLMVLVLLLLRRMLLLVYLLLYLL